MTHRAAAAAAATALALALGSAAVARAGDSPEDTEAPRQPFAELRLGPDDEGWTVRVTAERVAASGAGGAWIGAELEAADRAGLEEALHPALAAAGPAVAGGALRVRLEPGGEVRGLDPARAEVAALASRLRALFRGLRADRPARFDRAGVSEVRVLREDAWALTVRADGEARLARVVAGRRHELPAPRLAGKSVAALQGAWAEVDLEAGAGPRVEVTAGGRRYAFAGGAFGAALADALERRRADYAEVVVRGTLRGDQVETLAGPFVLHGDRLGGALDAHEGRPVALRAIVHVEEPGGGLVLTVGPAAEGERAGLDDRLGGAAAD